MPNIQNLKIKKNTFPFGEATLQVIDGVPRVTVRKDGEFVSDLVLHRNPKSNILVQIVGDLTDDQIAEVHGMFLETPMQKATLEAKNGIPCGTRPDEYPDFFDMQEFHIRYDWMEGCVVITHPIEDEKKETCYLFASTINGNQGGQDD